MRKIQTSINLTPEIKSIVDTEGLNLSKFVEDQLEKYFSVSSIEEVNKKIAEHQIAISALEAKRADLVKKGASETTTQAVAGLAEKELREVYRKRRDAGTSKDLDEDFLCSPKNLERLRALGWDGKEAVLKLRKWYDGL